jgi:hypothetical protein
VAGRLRAAAINGLHHNREFPDDPIKLHASETTGVGKPHTPNQRIKRRSRAHRYGAQTCAELRKRCASLIDISHLVMAWCGQNVANMRRLLDAPLLDNSIEAPRHRQRDIQLIWLQEKPPPATGDVFLATGIRMPSGS